LIERLIDGNNVPCLIGLSLGKAKIEKKNGKLKNVKKFTVVGTPMYYETSSGRNSEQY
jgi:hypothetical protein